jgi:hypothetical protein
MSNRNITHRQNTQSSFPRLARYCKYFKEAFPELTYIANVPLLSIHPLLCPQILSFSPSSLSLQSLGVIDMAEPNPARFYVKDKNDFFLARKHCMLD